MIDDLISAPAQDLGEQRELGFKLIKQKMAEAYLKKIQHTNHMIRGAMIISYKEALEDAFRVFSQIVESQGGEELIG
jgi:hypothetical protein